MSAATVCTIDISGPSLNNCVGFVASIASVLNFITLAGMLHHIPSEAAD